MTNENKYQDGTHRLGTQQQTEPVSSEKWGPIYCVVSAIGGWENGGSPDRGVIWGWVNRKYQPCDDEHYDLIVNVRQLMHTRVIPRDHMQKVMVGISGLSMLLTLACTSV